MNSLLYKISPFLVGAAVLVLPNTVYAKEQTLTIEQAKFMVLVSAQVSARSEYVKAKAFIPAQEGRLPDPILSLGALNFPVDTFNHDQENMAQLQVGISQALPFPGKLRQLEASASYLAKAASYDLDELKLQLVSRVQVRW
jgi:cobalt-zinc-cadmium efflux system outer membrane protein